MCIQTVARDLAKLATQKCADRIAEARRSKMSGESTTYDHGIGHSMKRDRGL